MEYIEVSGKTLDDAITEACQKLTVTSSHLDYEIIEKGSAGFLGIASKPAVIRARVKDENEILKEEKQESKSEKKVTEKKSFENSSLEPGQYNDPKEFLEKEHLENKKTGKQIAEDVGCTAALISLYFKKYNITMRTLI